MLETSEEESKITKKENTRGLSDGSVKEKDNDDSRLRKRIMTTDGRQWYTILSCTICCHTEPSDV
jgi:hypothetical protein